MGVVNWKGIVGHLVWYIVSFQKVSDLSSWSLLHIWPFQLPYEYLTPLQAAVGVVQKVTFLFQWAPNPTPPNTHTISYDNFMIIPICMVLSFHVVSVSTANNTQEYSTKACRAAWKNLETGSSSKAWLLRDYRNPAANSKRGIQKFLIDFLVWFLLQMGHHLCLHIFFTSNKCCYRIKTIITSKKGSELGISLILTNNAN